MADENPEINYNTVNDIPHTYITVDNDADIAALIQKLEKANEFCFDTETTGLNSLEAEVVGLSFSVKIHEAYYVPVSEDQKKAKELLMKFSAIFSDEKKTLIGQNIKYDYHILMNSNQMISDSQAILNRLHQLLMLNKGIYQDKIGEIGTAEKIKSSIKEYIIDLSNHQTFVQLNTFYLYSFFHFIFLIFFN